MERYKIDFNTNPDKYWNGVDKVKENKPEPVKEKKIEKSKIEKYSKKGVSG